MITLVSEYSADRIRVKNKIISTFEQYEGNCDSESDECHEQILDYMRNIGYSAPDFNLSSEGYTCRAGYCFKEIEITEGTDDRRGKSYFKVVTQINVDIPIINKILPGLKIFQITGDTMPIDMHN